MENGIDRADAFPGNVGNVEQAFYAAEVDECTVGHDLNDSAFEDSAFFDVLEGFFAFCFAFCFKNSFAGKDEAVLVFVDVDDFDLEGLAYEIVQRFNEFDIALGKGNETTQGFDGNDKASLVRFFTCTFDELVVFKSFADFFPVFDFFHLDEGNDDSSFFFNVVGDFDSQFVADFDKVTCFFRSGNSHFLFRQDCFCFRTDGNIGSIIIHRNNRAFDHVTFLWIFFIVILVQQFFTHYFCAFSLQIFHNLNNLLYYPIRRGSAGCNAYMIHTTEPGRIQFGCCFDVVCRAILFTAYLREAACVGAVLSANDDHGVHMACQFYRCLLTLLRRRAYGHMHIEMIGLSLQDSGDTLELLLRERRLDDDSHRIAKGNFFSFFFPIYYNSTICPPL